MGTGTGLEALSVLAEGLDHPECVATSPEGVLYAGGEAGQIYRVDTTHGSVREVANTGGFVLGISFDGNGRCYACDIRRNELLRVDVERGGVEVYSRGTGERPLVNPNLGAFDAQGNCYLTSSGSWHGDDGCIFRVDPSGRTDLWCTESSQFPNGCCIDGRSLLVAESTANAVTRIPIRPDGSAGPREVVVELPGAIPDGVALDVEGTMYVCCYRPDRVYMVTQDGTARILADDPEGTLLAAPANCAWIGERRERFVCANLGRWHLTAGIVGPPGRALPMPMLP